MAGHKTQTINDSLITSMIEGLSKAGKFSADLPFGARFHIDRKLPFIFLHRLAKGPADPITERLMRSEASYFIASWRQSQRSRSIKLLKAYAAEMEKQFGSFLIIELWANNQLFDTTSIDHDSLRPEFKIKLNRIDGLDTVAERFKKFLDRISIQGNKAYVQIDYLKRILNPHHGVLLSKSYFDSTQVHYLAIEVQPMYHSNEDSYPLIFRTLHRGISKATKQAAFQFTKVFCDQKLKHHMELGKRAFNNAAWLCDRQLSTIADSFDLILQLSPVNMQEAWSYFKSKKYQKKPLYIYRPIPVDPSRLKRDLFSVKIERVEDPLLSDLYREKQLELDRQITMLMERGNKNALYSSMQIYGTVDDELFDKAQDIMILVNNTDKKPVKGQVDATRFAKAAQKEINFYKKQIPGINSKVIISEEVSTLLVSKGDLYVSEHFRTSVKREQALIQHEVGTHILTYANAKNQSFQLLRTGFPDYDELQEGLAVLSEFLVGGLTTHRLRTLAARVIVARLIENGYDFISSFHYLLKNYNVPEYQSFMICSRIYRAGGLTKDAIYLRGLLRLIKMLKKGLDIKLLYYGKIGFNYIDLIKELKLRQVFKTEPLIAPILHTQRAKKRLEKLLNAEEAEILNLLIH